MTREVLSRSYKNALKNFLDNICFEWFVIGSANLALQDIDIIPSRLGILIHHQDLQKFLDIYKDVPRTEIILLDNGEAEEFVMTLHGIEIMVCAEYDHGIYWQINNSAYTKELDGMVIPCFSLLAEREAYKRLNMMDKVAIIDDFFKFLL